MIKLDRAEKAVHTKAGIEKKEEAQVNMKKLCNLNYFLELEPTKTSSKIINFKCL